MMTPLPTTLKSSVRTFIFNWSQFPIDYWWRKKYNVPFGSSQHRGMSFIDMYIEYQEEHLFEDNSQENDEMENEELGLNEKDDRIVKMDKKEIDQEFENLDLEQFDDIK